MCFGWLVLLYRPSRIQESLLFPFVLETRLRTIHTLTVFLLLIIQTHNVDTFWLRCHPLFVLLLTVLLRGLQNLSLPKDHLWTPEGIRLITYILYPPLRMNLSVGTDNDEACVLWPNRNLVGSWEPSLFVTHITLSLSLRREKPSHTMTVNT